MNNLEIISNEIFYHLQQTVRIFSTVPLFEVGKEYDVGHTINPFFNYFNHFKYPLNTQINMETMTHILADYQRFATETIFEEVRQQYFPELPSRQKCLWVIPHTVSLNEAVQYWNKFLSTEQKPKLSQLNCSGKIFYADSTFVSPTTIGNFPEYRKRAYKYWSGVVENPLAVEGLFIGKIKVIS